MIMITKSAYSLAFTKYQCYKSTDKIQLNDISNGAFDANLKISFIWPIHLIGFSICPDNIEVGEQVNEIKTFLA